MTEAVADSGRSSTRASGRNGFHHGYRRLRCHDAVEAKASLIE
jgi:hypothetical protein